VAPPCGYPGERGDEPCTARCWTDPPEALGETLAIPVPTATWCSAAGATRTEGAREEEPPEAGRGDGGGLSGGAPLLSRTTEEARPSPEDCLS